MNVYCVKCGNCQEGRHGPWCHIDGSPVRADPTEFPPIPEGWVYFDHLFSPALASAILDLIPADSHHWTDIERKAPEVVEYYTKLMAAGDWADQLVVHGFYEHPIRFDDSGAITHGVMRLLACSNAGRSFRAAVLCPAWMKERLEAWDQ